MLRRWILYLLALAGLTVFHMFYGQWISFVLLVGLLALPLFSLLISLPSMLRCKVSLAGDSFVQRGTPLAFFPLLSVRSVADCRGKLRLTHSITGESRRVRWKKGEIPASAAHCGMVRCEAEKMYVYDALGLFRLRVRETTPGQVLVMPEPRPVDPMPDLKKLLLPRFRPKPGGGYAENHELREYRPGDDLRQMHWKLSAKVDDLILREPMVPQEGLTLLTADLAGTPEEIDMVMGRLLWMSRQLLHRSIRHEIRCLTGNGIVCRRVVCPEDTIRALEDILSQPPEADDCRIREQPISAQWRYHILPGEEAVK
ncbi:MAG: DUF58 domain-containing protein [Faecousia sp.]